MCRSLTCPHPSNLLTDRLAGCRKTLSAQDKRGALLCMPNIFDVRSDNTTKALLASQRPQLLEPGVMIGRHERHECPLRLCVKGRLLVVRQPQEGTE